MELLSDSDVFKTISHPNMLRRVNDQNKNKRKRNKNASCDTARVYQKKKKKITECLQVYVYIVYYILTQPHARS